MKPRLRFFYYYKLSPVRHAKFSISTVNIVESGPRPTPSKCLNKFPSIPSCNRVIPKLGYQEINIASEEAGLVLCQCLKWNIARIPIHKPSMLPDKQL